MLGNLTYIDVWSRERFEALLASSPLTDEDRRTLADHPWWVDVAGAAAILAVSRERVRQLAVQGRVPALRHHGRWLFRRHQLEVVANARDARKLAGEWG